MADRYNIQIPKLARKVMSKIPLPWSERIIKTIGQLSADPYLGEKMSGKLSDCRKIRVWPYRVIYKIDKRAKTILIVEVNNRGNMSYD
ncbi:MAG: type II toxin-antitoxin system RelE/ParE family toxin [Candidatus Azambacteria bacterium]|nr:type II toxin-antitoxin system RelE/ParE family toxin [Candidatus Azambacteria bacterium]